MRQYYSSITSKGQVTIPVEIRHRLGVPTPGKLAWVVNDEGKIEVQPIEHTFASLKGTLPPIGRRTVDFDDLIDEAMDERADRIMRNITRQ
jgi:bifunctional DNA-binding transcriptional regulator/antitoxin component of YhaV-PrlF toxin-antitoxin module